MNTVKKRYLLPEYRLFFPVLVVIFFIIFSGKPCNADWVTYNTENSELVHNNVYALAIDDSGNIWIGTEGGVSKFDGRTDWTTFTTANTANGLANNSVWTIAIDTEGVVWIGTMGGGISRYAQDEDPQFKNFNMTTTGDGLPGDYIRAIAISTSNIRWAGTMDTGFSISENIGAGFSWSSYTRYNCGIAHNNIYDIEIDDSGAKWFGLNGYGISVLTGNDPSAAGAWTTYTRSNTNQELASDGIRSIEIDSSGNRWFGTDIKGVCVLDTTGNWTTYDLTNSGLSNNTVKQIKEDPVSGHIWIGTNGGGVCQYDGNTWITFDQNNSDIPSNFVQAIAIDNKTGYRWFGTQEGL
ncbi:MAG: two-component regulator propeller domain-containing protein, partial [Elusimicrobiota bacterium]